MRSENPLGESPGRQAFRRLNALADAVKLPGLVPRLSPSFSSRDARSGQVELLVRTGCWFLENFRHPVLSGVSSRIAFLL